MPFVHSSLTQALVISPLDNHSSLISGWPASVICPLEHNQNTACCLTCIQSAEIFTRYAFVARLQLFWPPVQLWSTEYCSSMWEWPPKKNHPPTHCQNVNKSLNSVRSSNKEIESFQKTWTKLLDSYDKITIRKKDYHNFRFVPTLNKKQSPIWKFFKEKFKKH